MFRKCSEKCSPEDTDVKRNNLNKCGDCFQKQIVALHSCEAPYRNMLLYDFNIIWIVKMISSDLGIQTYVCNPARFHNLIFYFVPFCQSKLKFVHWILNEKNQNLAPPRPGLLATFESYIKNILTFSRFFNILNAF